VYGYVGDRNDATQQSGKTPDKKQKSKTLQFTSEATLKLIRLECYLPRLSGANKVGVFPAESLVWIPAAMRIGFECRCNGQNISNRISDVTPLWDQRDKNYRNRSKAKTLG